MLRGAWVDISPGAGTTEELCGPWGTRKGPRSSEHGGVEADTHTVSTRVRFEAWVSGPSHRKVLGEIQP